MEQQKYLGHMSQLYGVEEVRLIGGKGDGMRLFQVRNASGLSFTVSADRAADISRLYFKGSNMGYFSPCGYVSPEYYDDKEDGFLKSFTAGFMTTCGLASVGVPCVDLGEQLPLHGTISNTPCETIFYEEDDNTISIKAKINDSRIFARKYLLDRRIICGKFENKVSIIDTVSNMGDKESPLMLLYHINFGYPLLSENAVIKINSTKVIQRNEHAAKDLDKWNIMEEPTAGFEEQCYYHSFDKRAVVEIYNPDINKGVKLEFDPEKLNTLIEWKMMGVRDYVLGLEPGNCIADGRNIVRKRGDLEYLKPGESKEFKIDLIFFEK